MKKISKIILSLCLVVCCLFTAIGLTGCGKNKLSATSTSTDGVSSNGGSVVTAGGYMYFINGIVANNGSTNTASGNTIGGLYRTKLNSKGKVDLNDDGTLKSSEKLISSVVGFEDGQIFVFGDFVYYTTPNAGKNSKAETLYNQTVFMRYDLKTKQTQKLFTTSQNNSSETLQYTYMAKGDALYLVVYEKSQTKITSIKIDTNVSVKVIASDAQSVVFGENNGKAKGLTQGSKAEEFIYFTRSALETGTIRTGVRVYKAYPDGSNETKISEGKSVSLLAVVSDKLVYSLDKTTIYAQGITAGDETLAFETNQIISNVVYDTVKFLEEPDGSISLLVFDNKKTIRYIKITGGVVPQESDVDESGVLINNALYTYTSTKSKFGFIGTSADEVVFTDDGIAYKMKFRAKSSDIISPLQLTSTKLDSSTGMVVPEILGDNLYFMYTKNNKTMIYRTSLNRAADAEIKEATLFGTSK